MQVTITRVEAKIGEDTAAVVCDILPGEEKLIPLPFVPEGLRAFAGDKEVCVYLAK